MDPANRIKAPPYEETISFLREASQRVSGHALHLSKDASRNEKLYRHQTSMLQWLRRKGHRVDFSEDQKGDVVPLNTSFIKQGVTLLKQFDGKRCPYCNDIMRRGSRKPPTRDHVRPRSLGATLANGNCLVVCGPCNNDKDDMTLEEFVLYLKGKNDHRHRLVAKISEVAQSNEQVKIGNAVIIFDDDDDQ